MSVRAAVRLLPAMVVAGAVAAALAQADETQRRGAMPLGQSRDESAPAAGAIKGGALEPGPGAKRTPEEEVARCNELVGQLREQCLRDLRASAGDATPSTPARDPAAASPPQKPRY